MARGRPDWSGSVIWNGQTAEVRGTREWYAYPGYLRTWDYWESLVAGGNVSRTVYSVPSGKYLLVGDVQFSAVVEYLLYWRASPPIPISRVYLYPRRNAEHTFSLMIYIPEGYDLIQYAENQSSSAGYYEMFILVLNPLGFSKKIDPLSDPRGYYWEGDWYSCSFEHHPGEPERILLATPIADEAVEIVAERFGQAGEKILDVRKVPPPKPHRRRRKYEARG